MKDFVVVSFPVQTPSLGKILLHKLQNQNALTFSQKLTLINREIIKPDCIFKPDCRSAECFHTYVISDFVHVTLVVKLQNQNFVTNFAWGTEDENIYFPVFLYGSYAKYQYQL